MVMVRDIFFFLNGCGYLRHIKHQSEEKYDLSDFDCARRSGLSVWLVDMRGQRRMARPVGADREAMITQITTLYNCGEQKSISARRKC